MALTKRLVKDERTDDQGDVFLRTMEADAEWHTGFNTKAADVATIVKDSEAGKDHVVKNLYVSFAGTETPDVALVTLTDGTTTFEHNVALNAVIPINLRFATATTIVASLASGGTGVTGYVGFSGLTIVN